MKPPAPQPARTYQWSTPGPLRAYGLAVVSTAIAVAITRFTWPIFSRTPYFVLFGACYVTSRWGTERAGYVAIFLGALGSLWAFPRIGPFESRAVVVFVLVMIVANRITSQRNRAVLALQASEAQFRATWEHAALGAAMLNRLGAVERINPALERILGYPSAAWAGMAFDHFSHPDDVAAERARFAELMGSTEAYYQREQRYQRHDGTVLWGRVTVSAIRGPDGVPTGALMVLEDVTARRQAEADLRASEEKLRRAQKMEAVGQLVAGVAHNFNNLLTVTMGYTELLLERQTIPAEDRTDLEEIRKAAARGAVLIRQLLAFSRKHETAPTPVDLNRTVLDLREMMTRVIREDIQLAIEVQPTPAVVLIDPHDLEQAVLNLVINARDALPTGGAINIDVARETIDATNSPSDPAVTPGAYARLRVRDNGAGMTPEVQQHLFEPFFTTKDVGKGTGLGLAFVYGTVRNHGGFITVDTAPGTGTTFALYLPLVQAIVAEDATEPAGPQGDRGRPNATILLVEDEGAVRAVTALTLSRAGYHVLEAATPAEAFETFNRNGRTINLLVTDIVMPEMHGSVLAKRLLAQRPDLRVLFVSGYSEVMPDIAAERGNVSFLGKPFAPSRLVAAVDELLSA